MLNEGQVITPVFRVAFENITEPQTKSGDGKTLSRPKYNLVMLFDAKYEAPKEQALFDGLKRQIAKSMAEKWPDKERRTRLRKNPKFKAALKNGDEKVNNETGDILDGFEGKIHASPWSYYAPRIIDQKTGADLAEPKKNFYSGCYARAIVKPYGFSNEGVGVSMQLDGILKVKDGERFAGDSQVDPIAAFSEFLPEPKATGFEDMIEEVTEANLDIEDMDEDFLG